jgi:hypothetical protein
MEINYSIVLPLLIDPQRPYLEARIVAHHLGQEVGYLKFEWVSGLVMDQILPTVWHHVDEFSGWCLGLNPQSDMTDPKVIKKLWLSTHSYDRYWQPSSLEPTMEEMLLDLDITAKRNGFYRRFEKFKTSIDWVYVGYSKVEEGDRHLPLSWLPEGQEPKDSYQHQGIGTTMYRLAAMWLAVNMNTALHSSTLRSKDAIGIWEHLIAIGYPIYSVRRPETNKYVFALDYTQTPYLLARAQKTIKQLPESLPRTKVRSWD